jgi:predicted alpha/beta hydrolase
MPNDLMKIIGVGLLMLAGATAWQALDCILRWQLGDVILGCLAGVIAYWLVGLGLKRI